MSLLRPRRGCGDLQLFRCQSSTMGSCFGEQPAIKITRGPCRQSWCAGTLIGKLCRLPRVGGDVVELPVEQLSHVGDQMGGCPAGPKVAGRIDVTEARQALQPTGSIQLVSQEISRGHCRLVARFLL